MNSWASEMCEMEARTYYLRESSLSLSLPLSPSFYGWGNRGLGNVEKHAAAPVWGRRQRKTQNRRHFPFPSPSLKVSSPQPELFRGSHLHFSGYKSAQAQEGKWKGGGTRDYVPVQLVHALSEFIL